MRITVQVKTGTRTEVVEEIGKKSFFVRTCAVAAAEANSRVAEQLAAHFHVPAENVTLFDGEFSQIKQFEIQREVGE